MDTYQKIVGDREIVFTYHAVKRLVRVGMTVKQAKFILPDTYINNTDPAFLKKVNKLNYGKPTPTNYILLEYGPFQFICNLTEKKLYIITIMDKRAELRRRL